MVLDHRHGKGIHTVLTPRIESTLGLKKSRLVATSLHRYGTGINTVFTPRISRVNT